MLAGNIITQHAMLQSIAASLAACFIAIQFLPVLESAVIALAVLGLSVFWQWKAPQWKEQKRLSLLERDLPLALQALRVDLRLNVAFERALEHVAEEDYGPVSKEFARALKEVRAHGASVPEALFRLGARNPSTSVRRAVSQLVAAYEQGSSASEASIQKLSQELLAAQRAEAKAFSGKIALYSLLFIALSAIAPAMFQSYLIVGSAFLDPALSPWQALLVIAVLFPLLDSAVLYYVQWKTPAFLRS